ncbi:unnamed protein product [Linum trigynum]|uniref:Reverse transcriptase domain-containing protein n=1 Tax=Linum trigynum TaxID=586398 RepID=A0AAV2GA56_9ROSI
MTEERREAALKRTIAEKEKVAKPYNSKVWSRLLEEGDMALKRIFDRKEKERHGQLAAKWEGPYLISDMIGPSMYKLAIMRGEAVSKTWNSLHLRKYYSAEEEM